MNLKIRDFSISLLFFEESLNERLLTPFTLNLEVFVNAAHSFLVIIWAIGSLWLQFAPYDLPNVPLRDTRYNGC